MVAVRLSEESRPGRWIVQLEDGETCATFTYAWLERTSPVSAGIGLVGASVEVDRPGWREGFPTAQHITPSSLRDVPWSRWAHAARACLDRHLDIDERKHQTPPLTRVLLAHPEFGEATPQAERRRRAHMRLVMVADRYRRNILLGLPDPAKEIASEWEVAPATARSWVHRARKEGYLQTVTPAEENREEEAQS